MSRRPARCTEADIPTGHIYFVHAPKAGAIKIGYSKDPRNRALNLNTGSPEPLTFIGSIPGNPGEEKAIYRKFKHSRLHGEWFRATDDLHNRIEDLADEFEELNARVNDMNGLPP